MDYSFIIQLSNEINEDIQNFVDNVKKEFSSIGEDFKKQQISERIDTLQVISIYLFITSFLFF